MVIHFQNSTELLCRERRGREPLVEIAPGARGPVESRFVQGPRGSFAGIWIDANGPRS